MDFPQETAIDPHPPTHMVMPIIDIAKEAQRLATKNDADITKAPSAASNNTNWQQKIFGMFTELQQPIKDIQLRVDSFAPSIEKINSINTEIKKMPNSLLLY
eukprot:Seg4337.1 transcript_id=Seg4337.1/GoldUCD/mRNA.D3Y31 product="hypothetical protein" protein_id=Seg4337.1/GoldUCD/D3Y31